MKHLTWGSQSSAQKGILLAYFLEKLEFISTLAHIEHFSRCWQSGNQLGKQWSWETHPICLQLVLKNLNSSQATNWARNSKQETNVISFCANILFTFLPLSSKPKAHWVQGLHSDSPSNTCHPQPWYQKTQGKFPCSLTVFASPASTKIG